MFNKTISIFLNEDEAI